MPQPLLNRREVAPPGHDRWTPQQPAVNTLAERIKDWLHAVGSHEPVFSRQVYTNPKLTQFDVRMHRLKLCTLMAEGEELALNAIYDVGRDLTEDENQLLDRLEGELLRLQYTYCAWHGDPEQDRSIPEEVHASIAELEGDGLKPMVLD